MSFLQSILAGLAQATNLFASVLAILLGAVLVYVLFARALRTLKCRQYLPERLVATFQRIGFWIILTATGLLLLQVAGILQSVMAAAAGVLALLAIGFVAVWSVLSNTLCSLILMIIRPYRVGDTLSLPPDDLRGKVVNFNLIFTTLETEDGCYLQVPNNLFFQRPVIRKAGKLKIGLADQLYESENASSAPASKNDPIQGQRQAA